MISQTVPKLSEARQCESREVSVCGGTQWKSSKERLPAQTGEHSTIIFIKFLEELESAYLCYFFTVCQGHKVKNWKVRLFVLRAEPTFLHYYDPSKDDITPVGSISLRGCLVSALNDNGIPSGVKGKVQGNLFKIITQADTHYYIQAPTHEERMEWIQSIRQLT
ncbi:pleckstrin-2-like [Garra rufa]|uniref:pleckstrin-2-like n=1 Tax=Garra rufa TaxID=137080 RepID=UPI003CCE632E